MINTIQPQSMGILL